MHGMTMARRLGIWAGSAALLAAAAVTGPAAGRAQAATGDLSCSGQFKMTFAPGLKPGGSSAISVVASLGNCTSANGKYTNLTSATGSGTGSATANGSGPGPCGLLFRGTGTGTIKWAGAGVPDSTISFTVNTDPSTGAVTFKCVITGGTLNGDGDVVAPVITSTTCSTGNGMGTMGANIAVSFS
ncbi:hypothetical protein GCM10010357_17680 [Streptomyces luteireticuli]|uniref:Uncharacterized protein n=2 Tax=Streptomyces luteireticuli TaxID=173858 RepID=A0ABP3IE55_9ACTN